MNRFLIWVDNGGAVILILIGAAVLVLLAALSVLIGIL